MLIEALVTITIPHPDGPPQTVDIPPGAFVDIDDDEAEFLIAGTFAKRLKGGVAAVALGGGRPSPPAGTAPAPALPMPIVPTLAPAAPDDGRDGDEEDDGDTGILDAFELLERDNPDHWTADGRPDVRALSAIAGRTVKAADRDRLWAEWTAGHGD